METLYSASEIVEIKYIETERMDEKAADSHVPSSGNDYCLMDDIDRLFESIDIKNSARSLTLSRNNGKQPIRVSSAKAAGIGISEPVSLKQALRGLCISQASEMAALKRLSKPATSARISEAGTIKRLYTSVVVEAHGSRSQLNGGKGSHVEISIVPELSGSSEKMVENMQIPQADVLRSSAQSNLWTDAAMAKASSFRLASRDQVIPFPAEVGNKKLFLDVDKCASSISHSSKKVLDTDKAACKSNDVFVSSLGPRKVPEGKLNSSTSLSTCSSLDTTTSRGNCLMKPILKHKNFFKKKTKQPSTLISSSSSPCNSGAYDDLDPSTSYENSESNNCTMYHRKGGAENPSPSSSSSYGTEIHSRTLCKDSSKLHFGLNCGKKTRIVTTKIDETSTSKEQGEFSQSSKSSIGEYSSNTSVSDESNLSGSCRSDHRPHMSKDMRWEAVRLVQQEHGSLSLRQFKLLRRLGCGDIGTVYLADLMGTNCLFAIKVMDSEYLSNKKKMFRAQTEKAILEMLDHPFLPTLYAHFVTDRLSCLVMEYCRGGDLHVLRQRQPCRSFPEQAARFYVAEVLLALEYLHMLGVVYRDLKPENILVREDGHIMLIDFDLSLRCTVNPMLLKSSSHPVESKKKMSSPCAEASCIHPFCLQPNWQVPCFTPIVISSGAKLRKLKPDQSAQVNALPQVVVEPTDARSNSFVGTHEYLAPEIVKGESHGSAVDWWTFGIFLFELLYGKTPFKGSADEDTLNNIVSKSLKFPDAPMVSFHARDLIRGLLVKDPENRLGSMKGAAEIKQHPFFAGLNWALIRCATPPELPKSFDFRSKASAMSLKEDPTNDLGNTEDITVFELF